MEYVNKTLSDDELKHWGILGMKWGVRRYQNKDGSLTPRGKKKYKEEMDKVKAEEQVLKNRKATKAKFDRLEAKKKANEELKKELDEADKKKKGKKSEEEIPPSKKRAQDMGDEELAYRIRRVQMEKTYDQLTAEPEPVEKGNGFVKDFWHKSAVPAIQEAGKSVLKDKLIQLGSKFLGIESPKAVESTVDRLKREYDELDYTNKIHDAKDKFRKNMEKDRAAASAKEAERAAKKAAKEAERSDRRTAKNFSNYSSDFDRNSNDYKSGFRWTSSVASDPAPSSNSSTARLGQSYVAGLLPAPRDDD